jgi:hypothetical protein
MPVPAGYKSLPGSERPRDPAATLIGRVEKSEPVAVTVLLRSRPDAPPELELDHWQRTPPGEPALPLG